MRLIGEQKLSDDEADKRVVLFLAVMGVLIVLAGVFLV